MVGKGPIILVDDDHEDEELFRVVLRDLGITNKLIYFYTGSKAFEYLKNTSDNPLIC